MKKTFLLIAGTAIMFAACNNEPKKEEGPSQAQIDSTVNAKVAEQEAAMKAKNDSVLAAQADSMAKAEEAAKKNTKTTKKTTKTTTTVAPAPPPVPVNPKDARFNEGAKEEVRKANTDKKAERFK